VPSEHIGQHRHPPGTCEPDTTAENRHNTIRAPQPCQEIPLEQMSDGALARMRPDLSIGAALALRGGNVRVAAARELGTHALPGRQCRDGS
jgi:hypothetical protein